jgi:hypothetical protein
MTPEEMENLLRRQVIGNAKGLPVPTLTTLFDRLLYAVVHPKNVNKFYYKNLEEDILQTEECCRRLRLVYDELMKGKKHVSKR